MQTITDTMPLDDGHSVYINDVDVEAPLRGTILFIRNQDVPGVIGRVGTILGERRVNIASFALGRPYMSTNCAK